MICNLSDHKLYTIVSIQVPCKYIYFNLVYSLLLSILFPKRKTSFYIFRFVPVISVEERNGFFERIFPCFLSVPHIFSQKNRFLDPARLQYAVIYKTVFAHEYKNNSASRNT